MANVSAAGGPRRSSLHEHTALVAPGRRGALRRSYGGGQGAYLARLDPRHLTADVAAVDVLAQLHQQWGGPLRQPLGIVTAQVCVRYGGRE